VGTLVPVIGLVQVGLQSMADRYTYLPSIGIAILVAWGIPSFVKNAAVKRKILLPGALVVLGILAAFTWRQCGYWKNSLELFSHTLNVTKIIFWPIITAEMLTQKSDGIKRRSTITIRHSKSNRNIHSLFTTGASPIIISACIGRR